jgi:hypothetical protein
MGKKRRDWTWRRRDRTWNQTVATMIRSDSIW